MLWRVREKLKQRLISSLKLASERLSVVPINYGDRSVRIFASSRMERRTRRQAEEKEPETIDWIHTYMRPGEVIFDIGANVGNYSLISAKHLKGNARIFAFEPAWFNFTQLNRNILLNRSENCVFAVLCAFSNQTGVFWFNYSSLEAGSAEHALGKAVQYDKEEFIPVMQQPVPVYTIDEMARLLEVCPQHIKIDVDGIEALIIDGARETLHNSALRSILCELTDSSEDLKAIEKIRQAGFQLIREVKKPKMVNDRMVHLGNYIFVRKEG